MHIFMYGYIDILVLYASATGKMSQSAPLGAGPCLPPFIPERAKEELSPANQGTGVLYESRVHVVMTSRVTRRHDEPRRAQKWRPRLDYSS